MERSLNLQTLSKPTQKKIRDAVGVNYGITKITIKDLIKLAKNDGVDIGKRKETRIKRTYEYFGEIENMRIEEENKKKVKKVKKVKVYLYGDLNANFIKEIKNVDMKKPFKLTFESKTIKGIKKELVFKHLNHLKATLDIIEGDGEAKNSLNTKDITEMTGGTHTFSNFSFTASSVGGGRDNSRSMDREFKTDYFTFKVYDPKSKNNNCGIKVIESILKTELDTIECRKSLNINSGIMLTTDNLIQLYKNKGGKKLKIISDDFDGNIESDEECVYYHNEHYYHIKEAIRHKLKEKKTKRGNLYWDIETRKSLKDIVMIGETECCMLKSAILSIVYKNYKSEITEKHTFISNEKSCVVQFKEWLSHQSVIGKTYNCFAHNGSRFDHYLLMNTFNENDILESEIQLRGLSIIGLQYKSHLFKDPCCFLVNSLSNLCNGYCITDEEKQYAKIEKFILNDKEISNTQLCFYKPELDYDEFLELQHTDKEFWNLYVKYCEYDCFALRVVWEKFITQCNVAIGKMGEWVLRRVNATSCNTIGSLSKKLIDCLNNIGRGQKPNNQMKEYLKFIDNDNDKYNFIKNFKRGGISHCNQAGKHTKGIMGVDIKSQYPTAMMKMEIPIGKSKWITTIEEGYGFYELNNCVFNGKEFKPVAESLLGYSLNWKTNSISKLYVDTFMFDYLIKNCGLVSYDFVKGLVSDKYVDGSTFFKSYVSVLYTEKEKEDYNKEHDKSKYNKPYREVVKLLLNSVSGKMNEDPSHYFQIDMNINEDNESKRFKMNGVEFVKDTTKTENKINLWITAGVMIYSYSKRLLFEYINCLPNKSDDVIHIETDGIYFPLGLKNDFIKNVGEYDGSFKEVCIGDKLGNIDIEVEKEGTSYWLGKKFYYIYTTYNKDGSIDYGNSKIKIKGIPTKTITNDGSYIDLVDEKFYEDIYNGKERTTEFSTLTKFLFDNSKSNTINIASYQMKRTTKAGMKYNEY
jgi:hypothetical protein